MLPYEDDEARLDRDEVITMELIRDRNSNIPFSLHDSMIEKVDFQNNALTLKMNHIFQYTDEGENILSGDIIFKDSDLEECSVLIFDKVVYEGKFSGNAMSMKEYIEHHSNLEFEILTEGYFGYNTIYMGWIREEGKEPVSGIMYLWNSGDTVYRVDE